VDTSPKSLVKSRRKCGRTSEDQGKDDYEESPKADWVLKIKITAAMREK
jgi:hypothetical protein